MLSVAIRWFINAIKDIVAKKTLEEKLGRKVGSHEIYSLNANMEAAEVTAPQDAPAIASPVLAPPVIARPMSGIKKIIIASVVAAFLFLVVAGGAIVFIMIMPEATYNRLNPFTPKTPAGAFPTMIGAYALKDEPTYSSYRDYCKCYGFTTVYKKGADSIGYKVYIFKTPEEAKKYMDSRSLIGGKARLVEQTDSRQITDDPSYGGMVVQLVSGPQLIYIGGRSLSEVISFENALPYAAFGMAQPPPRSADSLKESPIQALTLLDEFKSDRKAAEAKYSGKTFLFTGIVAGSGKTAKGIPFVAIQKPGTKVGMDSVLSCSFVTGDAAKIALLKNGDTIQFRGKVNTLLPIVVIEESRLE